MNWDYIDREMARRIPNNVEQNRVYSAIAERVLRNLVHYKTNGNHEDEDVVTVAIALAKISGEDVTS